MANESAIQLFRAAVNKTSIINMIADTTTNDRWTVMVPEEEEIICYKSFHFDLDEQSSNLKLLTWLHTS